MERDFTKWFSKFEDSIASWKYYTNFEKVYDNVSKIKNELNLLNGLIGSKDIENDFKRMIKEYPSVLKAIPILIAKRDSIVIIKDAMNDYYFNFKKMNYSIDEYTMFMRKIGIFELLEDHLISNLFDYVTGIEVGMDTNGRKGRTGDVMEDLVESYILAAGFVKDYNYFKEVKNQEIEEKWKLDMSYITNNSETTKKFDFVIKTDNCIYGIETNFYTSRGSKLNETARSYKMIAEEAKNVEGFKFVWFTDGKGWKDARNNLKETFDSMEDIYSIADMKNGIMKEVFK